MASTQSTDDVRALAERLMADLGVANTGESLQDLGWTFGFDRARRRLGACHVGTKRITLSRVLSTTLALDEVEDTIRHEIAHALDITLRGRTNHDATWRAWAVLCGARPERCYTAGPLPTERTALYAATCPGCGQIAGRHRQPTHPLLCPACKKAGQRAFLRVVHRDLGSVIWEGGEVPGPFGGWTGYTARCPSCGQEARAARAPRRAQACGACCTKHAGGRYDERFRLRFTRAARFNSR